jgi:hypothetical protein
MTSISKSSSSTNQTTPSAASVSTGSALCKRMSTTLVEKLVRAKKFLFDEMEPNFATHPPVDVRCKKRGKGAMGSADAPPQSPPVAEASAPEPVAPAASAVPATPPATPSPHLVPVNTLSTEFAKEILGIAVEVWRMEGRLLDEETQEPREELSTGDVRKLVRYAAKIKEALGALGIEIIDRRGQKYDGGFPERVISAVAQPGLAHEIIKATLKPTLLWNRKLAAAGEIEIARPEAPLPPQTLPAAPVQTSDAQAPTSNTQGTTSKS